MLEDVLAELEFGKSKRDFGCPAWTSKQICGRVVVLLCIMKGSQPTKYKLSVFGYNAETGMPTKKIKDITEIPAGELSVESLKPAVGKARKAANTNTPQNHKRQRERRSPRRR